MTDVFDLEQPLWNKYCLIGYKPLNFSMNFSEKKILNSLI